jgi:hypothetical protein
LGVLLFAIAKITHANICLTAFAGGTSWRRSAGWNSVLRSESSVIFGQSC